MPDILVIDDEQSIRDVLAGHASTVNCNVAVADCLQAGRELAALKPFDLIFLDVKLPDGDGLVALPDFKKLAGEPEVIIITGMEASKGAELAIKSGAWDYILKPFTKEEIQLQITRVMEFREKKGGTARVSLKREQIVGNSPAMARCLDLVAQCAASNVNVLLTGETGTGKEAFARTIHANSDRADGQFVVVDCAALPENLMESILYGHKKGSFTGADKNQTGLVKLADKGTLFLDEVGELPLSFQKSFLRILQERSFRPIGGAQEVQSDFRLISATNKNLDGMVAEGLFRQDLIYRLKTFHIDLPPLRNRTADIKDLILYYLSEISEKHGLQVKGFVPEFLESLTAYHWPGNVRELMNCLEKAILSDVANPTLYNMHLPAEIRIHLAKNSGPPEVKEPAEPAGPGLDFAGLFRDDPRLKPFMAHIKDAAEAQYLQLLLDYTRQDVKAACRAAGISQSRLYTLLKKHGITLK